MNVPSGLPRGTLSLLVGAHQVLLHPLFVAAAWTRLYGAPRDPRLWAAFMLHDLGYWGLPRMDDERGERHVEWGAQVMTRLFDSPDTREAVSTPDGHVLNLGPWGRLCLLHSRYYAARLNVPPSPLCCADKLAMALDPAWLYLPRTLLSGEAWEYLEEFAFGKYRSAAQPPLPVTLAEIRRRHLTPRTWRALRMWQASTASSLRTWAHDHAPRTPA